MTTALRSRTALHSRTARLFSLVCFVLAALGAAAVEAPAAFARVDPDGPYPYPATMPTPAAASTVTTHVTSGSGPATWLVVVGVIALLAAGAVLGQVARSVVRNRPGAQRIAIAS
jgi:hypothetical protein